MKLSIQCLMILAFLTFCTVRTNAQITADAGNNVTVCNGTTISLGGAPTASGGSGSYIYTWNGAGEISNATVSNPVFTPGKNFTGDSVLVIKVLVEDTSNGNTAEDSVTITVNYVPVVDLGEDTVLCEGTCYEIDLSYISTTCPSCSPPQWFANGFGAEFNHVLCCDDVVFPTTMDCDSNYQREIAEIVFLANGACFYSDTIFITFAGEIEIDLDNVSLGCVGDSLALGNIPVASGGDTLPYLFDWSYKGETTFSTDSNPVVPYADTAIFLEVHQPGMMHCPAHDSIYLGTLPEPSANWNNLSASYCSEDTVDVEFILDTTYFFSMAWEISSGELIDSSEYVVEILAKSNLEINMQVLDANGCTYELTDSVKYNPNPVASFVAGLNSCEGEAMKLYDNSVASSGSLSNSTFDFGDGSTSVLGDSVYHQFDSGGDYSIHHSITNQFGCIGDTTISVHIYSIPVVNAGPDNTFCPNIPVNLSASAVSETGSNQFVWYEILLNGANSSSVFGADSSSTSPVVIPNTGMPWMNRYVVKVTDSIGCQNSDTINISVINLEAHAGLSDTIQVCESSTTTLGAFPSSTGGFQPHTYSWSSAFSTPISNSTISNPTADPAFSLEVFYLRVDDNAGCFDYDTVVVTTLSNPAVSLSDTLKICFRDTVTLAQFQPEPNVGYSWSPGVYDYTGDALNTQDLNWVVKPWVSYTYVLKATNTSIVPNCVSMDTVFVEIMPLPQLDAGTDRSVCTGKHYTLQGTLIEGDTAFWESGLENDDTIMIFSAGPVYEVFKGATKEGCENTDTVFISGIDCDTLGTMEIFNEESFMVIYPNPSSGVTHFQPNGYIEEIVLYNSFGEIVFTKQHIMETFNADFSTGIYFAEVRNGKKRSRHKLIITGY